MARFKDYLKARLRGAANAVLLPPEASGTWLLDEGCLYQLASHDRVIVDNADFVKRQRLASASYIDFLVAYLMSLLEADGVLVRASYAELYPPLLREQGLECADEVVSHLGRDQQLELTVKGYAGYLEYAHSARKNALYHAFDRTNWPRRSASQAARKDDLRRFACEGGSPDEMRRYLTRLSTKMYASLQIAQRVEAVTGVPTRIFDSREYLSAVQPMARVCPDLRARFLYASPERELAASEVLDEMVQATLIDGRVPSILRVMTLAAGDPTFFQEMKVTMASVPRAQVLVDAIRAYLALTQSTASKQLAGKNLTKLLLADLPKWLKTPGVPWWLVKLFSTLCALHRWFQRRDDFSACPVYARFVAVAALQGPGGYGDLTWWAQWVRSRLTPVSEYELRDVWRQRMMGTWVQPDEQPRWFENPMLSTAFASDR